MRDGLLTFLAREAKQPPGRKAFQKLVYFFQAKGVPLGFRYGIHLFGPYSEGLSEYMDRMLLEGLLTFQPDGMSVLVLPGLAGDLAIADDAEYIERFKHELEFVIDNLSGLGSTELELLSTTHFLAQRRSGSEDDLVTAVLNVKAGKFSADRIREAARALRGEMQLLPA